MRSVEDFLKHYASEYYDPQAAHEYYMRNRELKERNKTSQEQSQAIGYANKQISTKRKTDLDAASANQKAQLEKLRADAEASRERIAGKLSALFEKLKAESLNVKLNTIPANASPKLRAYLESQNAAMLGKARKDNAKLYAEASKVTREEMKKVATDVKAAITAARDSYKANREALIAKYDQAKVTEEANIRQNIK